MSVAYLVLSHRNPAQVLRLVAALNEGPEARVLVRHDQRGSELARAEIERAGAEAIEDEIEMEWGGWSQLELILNALREGRTRHDPDWTLVLSGQDYPLRPMDEIEAALKNEVADARLGSVRKVERHRPPRGEDEFFLRARYRHYRKPSKLPHLPHALRPFLYVREAPPRVGVRDPRTPTHDLYVSADWLTLGRRALEAVLDADPRPFRRSAVPSESFFATVLLNRADLTTERDHRRFAPFAHPGAPHPQTLKTEDLDRILASKADFARKFDIGADARVLDLLDKRRRPVQGR